MDIVRLWRRDITRVTQVAQSPTTAKLKIVLFCHRNPMLRVSHPEKDDEDVIFIPVIYKKC